MNSEDIIKAQSAMCNEMYRIFSTLIAELTDVCVRSQMDLDEYKQSLPNLADSEYSILCYMGVMKLVDRGV